MTQSISILDTWPTVASTDPPWILITKRQLEDPIMCLPASASGDCCIRRISGNHIVDETSFHNELAAAFQFPWYYGRNLNAAIDCLQELGWCERKHRVVLMMVINAHLLIDVEAGTLVNPLIYLMDIEKIIGPWMAVEYRWSRSWVKPPTSFKLLLHASDDSAFLRLQDAVKAHTTSYAVLE